MLLGTRYDILKAEGGHMVTLWIWLLLLRCISPKKADCVEEHVEALFVSGQTRFKRIGQFLKRRNTGPDSRL